MNQMATDRGRTPALLLLVAGFGVAWNAFGIVQLIDFVSQTHESLMMKGMSVRAAELYYALPIWMKLAFALGSIGGLVGSVLLGVRRASAVTVLAASLAGYLLLFAGDYAHGVFDVIEGQMAILSVVIAIAISLFGVSVVARQPFDDRQAHCRNATVSDSRFDRAPYLGVRTGQAATSITRAAMRQSRGVAGG